MAHETIDAVIWYCDIRDSTALSENLPREKMIGLLNAFYSVMVNAVQGEGGEVLKFIGDAMLAVFRLDADGEATARGQALRAAEVVIRDMRAVNDARCDDGLPEIRFGIGLHVGEVMYGNIGGADRLDFTVIGPAVNLVSRIEKLSKAFDCVVVCTADFVRGREAAFRSLGVHELRGITPSVALFTPTAVRYLTQ